MKNSEGTLKIDTAEMLRKSLTFRMAYLAAA